MRPDRQARKSEEVIMRQETERDPYNSLPLRSLDQLSLQRQLEAIGETKDAGDKPASAAR